MSGRDRRALILGVLAIGVVVLYRLALSPAIATWQQERADAAEQVALLEELETKLDRRAQILRRLEPRFGPGVREALRPASETQIAFPRTVQEAIARGGGSATQVEVQGLRRIRSLPGVELLSLRVRLDCPADAIPQVLQQLQQAALPVIIESMSLDMAQAGQRDQWRATLVVSTPSLAEVKRS